MILSTEQQQQLLQAQTFLDKGDIDSAQRIIQTLPANNETQSISKEIEFRRSLLSQQQPQLYKTQNLQCPKCSNALRFFDAEATHTTCKYCNTIVLSTGAKVKKNRFSPPKSFLKLGMIGVFNNEKYQVIGVGAYRIKGYEREHDEDGYAYNPYRFKYNEYTLISENKQYLYIEESKEGYNISVKTLLANLHLPEFSCKKRSYQSTLNMDVLEKDKQKVIKEYGVITPKGYYGESSYIPSKKEHTEFFEITEKKTTYCVEWRKNTETDEIIEVESFASTNWPIKKIYNAFGLKKYIQKYNEEEQRANQFKKFSVVSIVCGVALVIAALFSTQLGTTIVSENIPGDNITQEGVLIGPFTLNQTGKLHRINLSGDVSSNREYSLSVDLLDHEQIPVNTYELDVWHESGYEGGESWSEGNSSLRSYFQLSEPGEFYLKLFQWEGTTSAHNVSIRLKEEVYQSRYFWIASVLSLLAACIYWSRGATLLEKIKNGSIILK